MKRQNEATKPSRHSRWDAAILALLNGDTREQAAQAAAVDPATIYRWQKDPKFQTALRESRSQAFGLAMGRMQQAANTAADTLVAIMNDPQAQVTGRVQAAKCILEQSRKSFELDDLRTQVGELQEWRRAQQEGSYPNAA